MTAGKVMLKRWMDIVIVTVLSLKEEQTAMKAFLVGKTFCCTPEWLGKSLECDRQICTITLCPLNLLNNKRYCSAESLGP